VVLTTRDALLIRVQTYVVGKGKNPPPIVHDLQLEAIEIQTFEMEAVNWDICNKEAVESCGLLSLFIIWSSDHYLLAKECFYRHSSSDIHHGEKEHSSI
jgi:hypothetical protein